MNISLPRAKPGLRERYDAVQNSAGRVAAPETLQNAPEAAILAPFERFWTLPAARTVCFRLSKTPGAKAVLDTSVAVLRTAFILLLAYTYWLDLSR